MKLNNTMAPVMERRLRAHFISKLSLSPEKTPDATKEQKYCIKTQELEVKVTRKCLRPVEFAQ